MPFVLELKGGGYVAVQGRSVVMQDKEGKCSSLTIETWESMITDLQVLLTTNPILSVMRLVDLLPGFNEVISQVEKGEPQQISGYSFDRDEGLGIENINFVAKPTI